MKAKVTPEEFAKVKQFFDLSENTFVEEPVMVTMMLCSGLTPDEQGKAVRLNGPLSNLFIAAGKSVRFCEGYTESDRRMIGFRDVPTGAQVASLPAEDFLALKDQELLLRVEGQLR